MALPGAGKLARLGPDSRRLNDSEEYRRGTKVLKVWTSVFKQLIELGFG